VLGLVIDRNILIAAVTILLLGAVTAGVFLSGAVSGSSGTISALFASYWHLLAPVGILLAPVGTCWHLLAPVGTCWHLLAPF
jgi:hypothetical protein